MHCSKVAGVLCECVCCVHMCVCCACICARVCVCLCTRVCASVHACVCVCARVCAWYVYVCNFLNAKYVDVVRINQIIGLLLENILKVGE